MVFTFNKGYKGGAGNPPNPDGIKTDYLWKEIFTKRELANIIENYAQVITEEDETTRKRHISRSSQGIISSQLLRHY